ncbi:hypothetical protein C8Q79DRAFT_990510 [Trametes meyenii]|nr:hypothetical protein C8Q79DRAFT_990510 [Trametes meyenii]
MSCHRQRSRLAVSPQAALCGRVCAHTGTRGHVARCCRAGLIAGWHISHRVAQVLSPVIVIDPPRCTSLAIPVNFEPSSGCAARHMDL